MTDFWPAGATLHVEFPNGWRFRDEKHHIPYRNPETKQVVVLTVHRGDLSDDLETLRLHELRLRFGQFVQDTEDAWDSDWEAVGHPPAGKDMFRRVKK